MTLYWWNTAAVARKLAAGELGERDTFALYLATCVMWVLMTYYAYFTGAHHGWLFLYEMAVAIAITVFGLLRCYDANGGDSGRDFVLRVVCLSFPLGVKINLLSLGLIWATYVAFGALVDQTTFRDPARVYALLTFVWFPAFTALFYWRLFVHLSKIHRLTAPVSAHDAGAREEAAGAGEPGRRASSEGVGQRDNALTIHDP